MRAIEVLAAASTWLADRLGLWRLDVLAWLAQARCDEDLAARLEASGFASQGAAVRESAARLRACARHRIPARADESWRRRAAA